MSLPAHHLLPSAAFRHISLMVAFMVVMSGFSLLGFTTVQTITNGWMSDINHSMSIEIPSYNETDRTVYTQNEIDQNAIKIQNYLQNDPLITNITILKPPSITEGMDPRFYIPSPIFITLSLNKNRAENSEIRLKNNIKSIFPNSIIKEKEAQEIEIQDNAKTFQTLFCSLTIGIMIVTGFILSSIIRTLLRANDATIQLIHLMGATSGTIAGLFKTSMTKAALWGICWGLVVCASGIYGLRHYIDIPNASTVIPIILTCIGCGFLILCRSITHWTVISSLRTMP